MKKICVVTGTRAEYGLLYNVISKIKQEKELELQLVVTGMHLSPEFGLTFKEIEKDGFEIADKVENILSADSASSVTKSIGLGMIGFADVLERLSPDIVMVLGDRYEIFAAAVAAMVANIPIVHLHGGELTEGLIDDSIRHSITKMSSIHFTSTEIYRNRVIQMGENSDCVFNVGALGVENIHRLSLLSKKQLEEKIHFDLGHNNTALVTFHPITLEKMTAEKQFNNLLEALSEIKDLRIIFTKANSDTGGRIINQMIDEYVHSHRDICISFESMGKLNYLSAMKYSSFVIGNSSSGIIEAPTFKIPTVNIGDRQRGRVQARSVINCDTSKEDIIKAIEFVKSREFLEKLQDCNNPYDGGYASEKIIYYLKLCLEKGISIKKKFYDLRGE
jgi:UDP-N-acetyl-D-glucosamine 2-epimerase, UDP-hydrolysing